jgi:hypothetical protein
MPFSFARVTDGRFGRLTVAAGVDTIHAYIP